MSPAAPTAPDWTDVLTALTGLRLAVYDELHRGGSLGVNQLAGRLGDPANSVTLRTAALRPEAIRQTLEWLAHHRLAEREESGRWRPRAILSAKERYERTGPDTTYAPGDGLPAQEGRGDRRSQGESAHAEVAGSVTLSPPKTAHPSRPIHAPQFFDFGDY